MKIFPIFSILLLISLAYGQEVGKSCTDRYTGQPGICQTVDDCQVAKDKASRGIAPTVCGFLHNTITVVCCEFDLSSPVGNLTPLNKPPEVPKPPPTFNNPPKPIASTTSTRISEIKCEEYKKYTTESVIILPLVTIPDPTMLNVTKCEYEGIPLIVGGKPAAPGEFPFMAALKYSDDDVKCGGTLISEKFVLTAGHCARTKLGPPISVRLGDLNLAKEDDAPNPVEIEVEKVIIHPLYKPPKKYNDIALLQLKHKVQFDVFLRPACLWTQGKINSPKALATGWGTTSFSGPTSDALLKVALPLLDTSFCSNVFQTDKKSLPSGVADSMLCAGELKGNKDTCQGDSGGPLLITQNDNNCLHYIVGITSFGRNCGSENTPAIYTRISSFVEWIEDNVWK